MRDLYLVGERGQKLKYHIQSSGRSQEFQEFTWNDYRTTLQALYALSVMPTAYTQIVEMSIWNSNRRYCRRCYGYSINCAKEYGWLKNENPLQGSFIVDFLTNEVEEQILRIFEDMNRRVEF